MPPNPFVLCEPQVIITCVRFRPTSLRPRRRSLHPPSRLDIRASAPSRARGLIVCLQTPARRRFKPPRSIRRSNGIFSIAPLKSSQAIGMERLDVDVLIAREVLRIERQNLFDAILRITATKRASCEFLPETRCIVTRCSQVSSVELLSGSTENRSFSTLNSREAASVVIPKPLSRIGRVATAQNSTQFCTVMHSVSLRARITPKRPLDQHVVRVVRLNRSQEDVGVDQNCHVYRPRSP
jgi:hypothetical protein